MDHLKEKQQKPLDEIDQMLSEFTVLSADELLGEFTPPSAAKAEPNTVQKTAVPPAEPEPLSPTEEPASQQAAETETIIEPEEQEETPAAMPESEEGPENWEALSVEDMFRALETEKPGGEAIQEPPEERVPEERVETAVKGAAAPARRETEQPPPKREEPRSNAAAGTAVAVEAVVASTVDSVLAERKDEERRYQKQRRKNQHQQEKMHRSNSDRAMDTVDFSAAEPSLAEATIRQKRRFRRLRKLRPSPLRWPWWPGCRWCWRPLGWRSPTTARSPWCPRWCRPSCRQLPAAWDGVYSLWPYPIWFAAG